MLKTDDQVIIEDRIKQLCEVEDRILKESALYSLIAPSKRIRPKMVLSISGLQGLDVACAIEMIHTYTLIHDDLPAMDDDDMRRGKPSLHKHSDEATAILTGDFLLTKAFEILSPYPQIVKVVAQKIGAGGILGGQIKDLAAKEKSISLEEYIIIAKEKTGALFSASCMAGALISGKNTVEIALLDQFGAIFGLIFQIIDDLNDKFELSSIQSIIGETAAVELCDRFKSDAEALLEELAESPTYLLSLLR